ncbi:fimbrial protein [Citrobacter braakii]|uniref:fimbrial protein n=1 Tax=Citrobacter braakii TaxID=57706 RepID=UPI001905CDEF|nr:fimbrial protein [Citrobacter braakii]MBJ8899660.1 fimbrial protein [Citrobacter braakii]
MKKLSKIALTIGLLGTALVTNAKDLSTQVAATATVVSSAKLTATYTAGAPLTTDNLKNQSIGTIALTGYQGTPAVADLNVSDARGAAGNLELKDASGSILWVKAFINGQSIKLNGTYATAASQATGNLPAQTTNIDLKTWESQEDVPAGQYSDDVIITLSNQ